MTDYYAYDAQLPCKNPNCHSHGSPHPNCRCYAGSGGESEGYAKGGSVCSRGMPHEAHCEYFANGGAIPQPDDLHNTLGMYAAHKGLMGLLRDAGHSKLTDPDKHVQKIHDFQNEPDVEKKNQMLHGHPLTGGAPKAHLDAVLSRLTPPVMAQEPSPEAMRSGVDYLSGSMKGESHLDSEFKHLFNGKASDMMPDDHPSEREQLKQHLERVEENPELMLTVGGSLGHYLPEHSGLIAAQSAQAVNYFKTLKPQEPKLAPFDAPQPVDKMAQAAYDRQLTIAEKPTLVLKKIKEGTLIPQDLATVKTLYPGLFESMIKKAGQEMIEQKTKNKAIPYKTRQSLSQLLGVPLDFTQTMQAKQAVLASASQLQKPPSSGKKNQPDRSGRATGVELKQINKVDQMAETPLEARQINKNSR